MRRKKYKLSDYSLLKEDTYEIDSELTQKSDSAGEEKIVSKSHQKNIDTGRVSDIQDVDGQFSNGVHYSSEDYKDIRDDKEYHSHKYLSIGKEKGKGKMKRAGIAIDKKQDKRRKLTFFVDGEVSNAVKFIAKIATLGVKPGDVKRVLNEITTDIDTSELDQAINETLLSRGSLYRKRYHGRY